MKSLSLEHSPLNWFDLMVVIVIMFGIRQGRKNGMSVELTPMLQWLTIVAVCAVTYRPLGDMLADSSPMSHLFCYITCYIIMAIMIKCTFSMLKKLGGGKLTGSDVFGRAEFYLGMLGGAIRFLCILLAGLAILNAPYYSAQEIASTKAYQEDMYGSTFFPCLSAAQIQIFRESCLGSLLKNNAEFLLIASTKSEHKDLPRKKED
ncbi:MAG TPA: CvpA family protein [Verrucomicrobiae bacterium]|jgi:hypothetical protein|nr:CvpA family protein [Verrucomicrobiae bacterium]